MAKGENAPKHPFYALDPDTYMCLAYVFCPGKMRLQRRRMTLNKTNVTKVLKYNKYLIRDIKPILEHLCLTNTEDSLSLV